MHFQVNVLSTCVCDAFFMSSFHVVCPYLCPFSCQTGSLWDKLMTRVYSLWVSNNTDGKKNAIVSFMILGAFFVNKRCMYSTLSLQESKSMAMLKCYVFSFLCHEIVISVSRQHASLSFWRLMVRCKLETKRCTLSFKIMYLDTLTNDTWVCCTKPELLWCLIIWSHRRFCRNFSFELPSKLFLLMGTVHLCGAGFSKKPYRDTCNLPESTRFQSGLFLKK